MSPEVKPSALLCYDKWVMTLVTFDSLCRNLTVLFPSTNFRFADFSQLTKQWIRIFLCVRKIFSVSSRYRQLRSIAEKTQQRHSRREQLCSRCETFAELWVILAYRRVWLSTPVYLSMSNTCFHTWRDTKGRS